MQEGKIRILGEKETFLIRILAKKMNDAGIACEFVPWSVDEINTRWDSTGIFALYMDASARPNKAVLHFLAEKASEGDHFVLPIGEAAELQYICDNLPGELIYKTFLRPINNEEFIRTVQEIQSRKEQGEFRKSILIVDDDPNYLGLVREWLKGTYKVSMANSGLQAIKWLGKNKADLILLDYEMPVTSGPQVLEMLRSDVETQNIPVIFLTGKGDKESVMAVVELKPQGYFLKNIGREELLEKLKDFFVLH